MAIIRQAIVSVLFSFDRHLSSPRIAVVHPQRVVCRRGPLSGLLVLRKRGAVFSLDVDEARNVTDVARGQLETHATLRELTLWSRAGRWTSPVISSHRCFYWLVDDMTDHLAGANQGKGAAKM